MSYDIHHLMFVTA